MYALRERGGWGGRGGRGEGERGGEQHEDKQLLDMSLIKWV
jgi:hypothetical protein